MPTFESLFQQATGGFKPFSFQVRLATEGDSVPSLLAAPTGLGKTAAAVLAWVWRRRFADGRIRKQTPRRLVYCLPMRVVVEQTHSVSVQWLKQLGLYAEDLREKESGWARPDGDHGNHPITAHLLMGGQASTDWALWPERDAVLIGTQDMLLSRALNRGYGMSRYRWPTHFGLLNNDCLWVIDEVQLMGSGLLTTAQLAAFGETCWPRMKRSKYLWMSATLGEGFLATRDRRDWGISAGAKVELTDADRAVPEVRARLHAAKSITVIKDCPKVSKVFDDHVTHALGRLSLVVFNTVPAARRMFEELKAEAAKPTRKKKGILPGLCLIHGRFRPSDRQRQLQKVNDFASRMDRTTGAVAENAGLMLVSTQVVEAGLDISSIRLWSEIAPWPSAVQRLGRLNREGLQPGSLATFWRPKEDKDRENKPDSPNAKRIGPYDKRAIDIGQELLERVAEKMSDGAEYRDALDDVMGTELSCKALEVAADIVIRPDDVHGLFVTDPDLAGGFTNISQFVRNVDRNVDVQVFWRDLPRKITPRKDAPRPDRDELCSIPFFELRHFLGDKDVAWGWNAETTRWEPRRAKDIWPGMTLLLPVSAGGYSDELGWTGHRDDKPSLDDQELEECVGLGDDPDSQTDQWYSLPAHLSDVEAKVACLAGVLELGEGAAHALKVAGRWHDWGKSLPRWQQAVLSFATRVQERMQIVLGKQELSRFHELVSEYRPKWTPPALEDGEPSQWAKFPDLRDFWRNVGADDRKQLRQKPWPRFAPRLRHEAASALAAWDAWLAGDPHLSALSVFLIASHHGKVRTVLRSTHEHDEVFGLQPSDKLQPVANFFEQETSLHFSAKHLGAHGTWEDAEAEFHVTAPSWAEVLAALIGPVDPNVPCAGDAISEGELRGLGPFVLAYLEAILVAADIRATMKPGTALEQHA